MPKGGNEPNISIVKIARTNGITRIARDSIELCFLTVGIGKRML